MTTEHTEKTAIVQGTRLESLPTDLYIPPEALQISLDNFEGPLDLLLYLIQRHHFDILNIPMLEITRQYLHYVELMKTLHLDLAVEYLLMAAMLIEIKSRLLLPTPASIVNADSEEAGGDPRLKLVKQLQDYARYKQAAQDLDALPRCGRDRLLTMAAVPQLPKDIQVPNIPWPVLLQTLRDIMARVKFFTAHRVVLEPLSVRERMGLILVSLQTAPTINFNCLFTVEEGRAGVVVTFLAILELVKESLIRVEQAQPFDLIQLIRVEIL